MALSERELYACHQRLEKPLFNVLYRMLWNKHESEDVIQEAFLRAWRSRVRIDVPSLDGLIWVSAMNLARNRLRWHRLWRAETFDTQWPDSAPTPEQCLEHDAEQSRVRRALRQLPKKMREIVLLTEFAELKHADVARVLHIPIGTVASRRHHALQKLRALLEQEHHE